MNILDEITAYKIREVEERKRSFPPAHLERDINLTAPGLSLKNSLRSPGNCGIIAEFKRKSPSAGIINTNAGILDVCNGYESAGAAAISILTDYKYFGGNLSDLKLIKETVKIPILRKDFIIDEYQVLEAKAAGADAILLIAAALGKSKLNSLHRFALSLGLEVLVEVHSGNCIDKIPADAEITGINCRDLKSFTFKSDSFQNLVSCLPKSAVKIAESGINSPEQLLSLRKYGFEGFLIGSFFMKAENPGKKCNQFIKDVNKLTING